MITKKRNSKMKEEGLPSAGLSEKALIKLVINNNDLFDVAGLKSDDFMETENRMAWEVIGKIRKSGKMSATYSSVADVMAKMGSTNPALFISEVKTTTVNDNDLDAHVASIRSSSFGRKLMDLKTEMDAIANSGLEPDEMVATLFDLVSDRQSEVVVSNSNESEFERYRKEKEERRKNPGETTRLPTYYRHLDMAFNGGLPLGYHIVGALPSVGKTTFTLQTALQQALRGHKVLFVSMEMLPEQLFDQCIAIMLGFSRAKIESMSLSKEESRLYDKAVDILDELIRTNLMLDFKERQTPASIETSIIKAKRKFGKLDIMYVDYLQYVDAPKDERYNADHERFKEISKCLRDMYKKHKIVVVALSQLNRTVAMGEIPSYDSIAGSNQIERDAGIIMMLYVKGDRKQFGAQNKEMIGMEVIKGRTEGRHSLDFEFKPSMTRFSTTFDFMNIGTPSHIILSQEQVELGTVIDKKDAARAAAVASPKIYMGKDEADGEPFVGFWGEEDLFSS